MSAFESIANRRIQAAQREGLLDNLPGSGKPIPDLETERPPGWWATRIVKRERSKIKAEDLDRRLRLAKPRLWRQKTEADLAAKVVELNAEIDDYNRTTSWELRERLDQRTIVDEWRRLR